MLEHLQTSLLQRLSSVVLFVQFGYILGLKTKTTTAAVVVVVVAVVFVVLVVLVVFVLLRNQLKRHQHRPVHLLCVG